MEHKDREILVGENRLYLGEDNILYATMVGTQDVKMVIALKEANDKLMNMIEGRVNTLIDLSQAGKPSPESRKVGREMLESEKNGKVAFWGLHPVARVIASFMMGVTRKRDMRVFKTKQEALAWLRE